MMTNHIALPEERGVKMKTQKSSIGPLRIAVRCVAGLVAVLALVSAALAAGPPDHPSTQQYVYTSFDPPGSVATFPIGINNNGLIAIQYNDADGIEHSVTLKCREREESNNGLIAIQYNDAHGIEHACTLKDGAYTVVDVPNAYGTGISAPDMEGQVALGYFNNTDFNIHSAVYMRGRYTYQPDAPGYSNTSPSAMNAAGHISGTVWNGPFVVVHGYIWDGKSYTIFDHPASDVSYTLAFGINDHGDLVGQYNTSDGVIHGFLKEGHTYTEVKFPGAPTRPPFPLTMRV